ncbi:hypothetical protein [Streptomyces sp. TRM68416]|uniref:hypothetical protein n=1 Tax=Streptomyces sp. TRM68416 TaxID=2758412 RepID=UPI001661E4BB|nr:hypothetical protein [Streptomyces sp. TRM68416]MBD0843832.1 hypothetical protein [Streptomyces sp. TRM68416]
MKAVVHRGARPLQTENRVAGTPAPGKEWRDADAVAPGRLATEDTEALRTGLQRDRARRL